MSGAATSVVTILYFASVRERAGVAEEVVTPGPDVGTVGDLVAWIRARGGRPAEALGDLAHMRCAVDQVMASLDTPIGPGAEVAFFPPMTGGAPR